ncbi:MAG: PKD domain-containing protein [Saprospiraceae bacterium]
MRPFIRSLFLFVILLLSSNVYSKHIIGGEVTYVCNGNGTYTFTMSVYRDCGSDGADFDAPAIVTVYQGTSGFALVENLEVLIDGDVVRIPIDDNPCIEPIFVCVEKAVYTFTISAPGPNQTFHVVYQRCCRNETINNLILPEEAGATFTMELTPEAVDVCNNSPVFNDFPPIVICAGEDIDFDHSATDPDGDQLVYSFCSPLLGGGTEGTPEDPGDPTSCVGVAPDPGCPPPYFPVNFIDPQYGPSIPMGTGITIDPVTGVITGIPTVLGQFVVGVCVEEYRNGQLLSVVRRDFQFNVTSCTPLVNAFIGATEIINDNEFVILSCGSNTVNFDNQSIQEQNIDTYEWEFELPSGPINPTEWEPVIEFPDLGTYNGSLILNAGTPCGDTALIEVRILPDIEADFSFEYDTCVSAPVEFTDLSFTGSGVMTNWDWSFGDELTSTETNPEHLYMIPGNLPVELVVTDINGCKDSITQFIEYFPVPSLVVIEPSTFFGCEPLSVFFNNLSFPIDSTYDVIWDFGDGTSENAISPTHIYNEGIYDVSIDITSPIGCETAVAFDSWVTALGSPIAGFDYTPKELNNFDNEANFIDQSQEAVAWRWFFDDEGTSILQNPSFVFPDTGIQVVQQVVFHESGCTDTAEVRLDIIPEIRYFLPNAFTPNFDALNDVFKGTGIFGGITNFQMTIWNRWGERIFETNDPDQGWNGRKNNVGVMSQQGVYVYVVNFTGPRGEPYNFKGFATLVQ